MPEIFIFDGHDIDRTVARLCSYTRSQIQYLFNLDTIFDDVLKILEQIILVRQSTPEMRKTLAYKLKILIEIISEDNMENEKNISNINMCTNIISQLNVGTEFFVIERNSGRQGYKKVIEQ
ncbi:MAG: hypothetical protein ABIM99_06150 [Candidatus Dojkabacteria bacterium]